MENKKIKLRKKAEEKHEQESSIPDKSIVDANALKFYHELEVHKIELELQNVELKLAKENADILAEKYSELYDFAPSGYVTLSSERIIIELNLLASTYLGKNRGELLNKSFLLLLNEESKYIFDVFIKKILTSNKNESCEVIITQNRNSPLHILLSGIVKQNENNYYISLTDITYRKQIENVQLFLLQNKRYDDYSKFFESITKYLSQTLGMEYVCIEKLEDDGYTTQTLAVCDGKNNFSHVSLNLKETPFDFFIGKTSCYFQDSVSEIFPKNTLFKYLKAKSFIGVTIYSFINKPIGFIAVIGKKPIDNPALVETILKLVSMRVARELEIIHTHNILIKAKEKAEESDRLKSAFLANMSHEIRTPISGILGFAYFLKNQELSFETQKEYISIIEKSGLRMLNIINDIIVISKIDVGIYDIDITATNINEQIEFIYSFFKPEAELKGLKFKLNNNITKEGIVLNTDKEKIYSILTNIIKNAIKFTNKGVIEFGYNIKDDFLEFYIKDTGIGINIVQQKIIFERFRQGSESYSREYEGSGLGLSISKAYVELLGGKIWVESERDIGSTFYFTLPYDKVSANNLSIINDTENFEENKVLRSLKILIVEDDNIIEKIITLKVEKYSKEILRANNGLDALRICKNNLDIDLILMDIKLPIMDGYDSIRQIRKFNAGVIIFAQTAYTFDNDRQKAFDAGCNEFITKPYERDIIEKLIEEYFKK